MKTPSRVTSRPGYIVCPACGRGELATRGPGQAGCALCGRVVERAFVEALAQIALLPDALGGHACECGHPWMRRLPDGVFHCPACGSEVTPPEPRPETERMRRTTARDLEGGERWNVLRR